MGGKMRMQEKPPDAHPFGSLNRRCASINMQ
jgi:hypothetical protein